MRVNLSRWMVAILIGLIITVAAFVFFKNFGGKTEVNWKIMKGREKPLRAVHMGGNWGGTQRIVEKPDEKYFEYLRDLAVNWVGISVALHVDDSTDSNVKRSYSGVDIPTFTDDNLIRMIKLLRKHGFRVYLTLAFEDQESQKATRPVHRWQLGDPNAVVNGEIKNFQDWPWAPNHPNHTRFVDEFWRAYTDQAVHFARIAQESGVELYSIGTETEQLFRSRSDADHPNHFKDQIMTMVKETRQVYSGKITYDMHYSALLYDWPGSKFLFEDIDFDVVGISAYFELVDHPPAGVLTVNQLEESWEKVFQKYLVPLKNQYPRKSIVFTEFGYVTAVEAPYNPASEERRNTVEKIVDRDNNGLDDAQEQQAHIYEAFYNTVEKYPDTVEGAFTWQESFPGAWAPVDIWGVWGKLAKDTVKKYYTKWRGISG